MHRAPHQGGVFRRHKILWILVVLVLIIFAIHHCTSLGPRLKHSWNKFIYTSSTNVSIAVYSPKTHRIYSSTNDAKHKFHTASTVKVSILAGLLVKQDGILTSSQQALAKKMIEQSDNDATTELFNNLGQKAGLQKTFTEFGMKNSIANSQWGLTTTTPTDQVKLLNNIFYSSKLLNNKEQTMIKKLMANVEQDQAWGVSAGSSDYALKNGWLSYGSDGWIVNSIGYIKNNDGSNYTIAVYTDKNSSMLSGQQTIEQLARATKSIMD